MHPVSILAAAAATAAASAPSTRVEERSVQNMILYGIFFAWLVFAGIALVRIRFFSGKPLLKAPPRTALALLPLALGTFILYMLCAAIAINAAVASGYLPHFPEPPPKITGSITPGATSGAPDTSQAATAAAPTSTAPISLEPAAATAAASTGPAAPAADPDTQNLHTQIVFMSAEFAAVLTAVFFCRKLFIDGLRGMGLSLRLLPAGLLLGLAGFLILQPYIIAHEIVVQNIYDAFQHDTSVHQTVSDMRHTQTFSMKLIFALLAGCGAPIAEEIFFRGLLQTALIQKDWGFLLRFPMDRNYRPSPTHRWIAIALCSAAFAASHVDNPDQMPILFPLALGLGYLYERTGNLWAPILVHALFNWFTLQYILRGG